MCPKGYRFVSATSDCVICPENTYNDNTIADSCTPCPGETDPHHTPPVLLQQQSEPGSTSRSDCSKKFNHLIFLWNWTVVLIISVRKQLFNKILIFNLGCPVGYIFDTRANTCVGCLRAHYYSDGMCIRCPDGQSTANHASIGPESCEDTDTRKNIL